MQPLKPPEFWIIPDPPVLAFLEKARVFPKKARVFSLRGTPKLLGKERKNAQKSKENRKTKKARKSKKAKIGGSFGYESWNKNCHEKSPNMFRPSVASHSLKSLTAWSSTSNLVHRIAAFAFAFAMAIPRCQWRHRCVVTLGKFLVVLYSQPLWRKEKWKQRRKGDVRDVKNYHGRC